MLTLEGKIKAQLAIAVVIGLVALIGATPAIAKDKAAKPYLTQPVSPKKTIRFYKANKQLQADRVQFTGKGTDKEGCHNLLKKTRIYKAQQIGFATCSLYEKKDCAVSSLVPVQSEKQLHSSYLLREGVAWLPQGENERGITVASWYCGSTLELGELREENTLAKQETNRLKRAERDAKKALEEAQADYAKAQKAKKRADEYAERTKQEAIAQGAIDPDPEEDEDSESSEEELE